MCKISIIVFFGLCSGFASRLSGAQANNALVVEKAMINNNPQHKGQENNKVTSEVKKQKNDVMEVYGHKIPKGKMETGDYEELWQEFKKREKAEANHLTEIEEVYRMSLQPFYEGEMLEKVLGSFIKSVKIRLEQNCMSAICIKVRGLEKKRKSKCFKQSNRKVTKK